MLNSIQRKELKKKNDHKDVKALYKLMNNGYMEKYNGKPKK